MRVCIRRSMRADQFLYVFHVLQYVNRYAQGISVVLFAFLFTGIPVTIYSTIELSDSVIVLGQTLKI